MRALNDKTIFRCSITPSVTFKVSENTHNKMKSAVGKILTENTMLTGVGVCPNLGPGPCAFVPVGSWSNTSSKIKINSCNTLTEHSCIYCSMGGKITAVTGDLKVNITRSVSMGVMNTPLPKIVDDSGGSVGNIASKTLPSENVVSAINEEIIKTSTDVPMSDKAVIDEEKKVSPENVNEDEAAEEVIPEYPYALCDYKNCSEWKNCEYLKADYSAGSVNNNSDELERNYKRAYPEKYDEYCRISKEMNRESSEGNWGKAAHHIISGNQIFALHPYLVKLANFYGYDINNGVNCILLPSTSKFSSQEKIIRQANAYVAMSYMKQQWHVGGHSYTMDSKTVQNIYEYLEKTFSDNITFYRNYAEAVEHEISILESKYSKLSCRKKDYENKKNKFTNNMNMISQKVKGKLLEFREAPKKSFPYYVSNEAVHYAFDIPNRKKFIIIYNELIHGKMKATAVKMNVTRYKKDEFKILFSDSSSLLMGSNLDFIKFAENIRFFICLYDGFTLPWTINPTREYFMYDSNITGSIEDYCHLNEQRIISFVEGRGNGEMTYEPPAKIIRQRINEMR